METMFTTCMDGRMESTVFPIPCLRSMIGDKNVKTFWGGQENAKTRWKCHLFSEPQRKANTDVWNTVHFTNYHSNVAVLEKPCGSRFWLHTEAHLRPLKVRVQTKAPREKWMSAASLVHRAMQLYTPAGCIHNVCSEKDSGYGFSAKAGQNTIKDRRVWGWKHLLTEARRMLLFYAILSSAQFSFTTDVVQDC